MSAARQAGAVLAEAYRGARGRLVSTLVIGLLVAALLAGVLTMVGGSAAAEARVLAQFDAAGTRALTLRARPERPLTTQLLRSLQNSAEVVWAVGLGSIADARGAALPGGPPVAVRTIYGSPGPGFDAWGELSGGTQRGLASAETAALLGFVDGAGTLETTQRRLVELVGTVTLPEGLTAQEPIVLVPTPLPDGAEADLTLLIVQAREPQQVPAVEALARSLLADGGWVGATVETSRVLAEVRGAVSGELGAYRRTVVGSALLIGMLLVGTSVFLTTTRQRKDFGRRRALGARRTLIATLVLAEVAIPAVGGSALGIGAATVGVAAGLFPGAPTSFTAALAVASIAAVLLAALAPAVIAARRDPLLELRVP